MTPTVSPARFAHGELGRCLLLCAFALAACGAIPPPRGSQAPVPSCTPLPSRNGLPVRDDSFLIKTVPSDEGFEVVAGRVLVAFQPGVSGSEQANAHVQAARHGAAPAVVVKTLTGGTLTFYLVDVSCAASVDCAIRIYKSDPRVRYAEPDGLSYVPEDAPTRRPTLTAEQRFPNGCAQPKGPDP